MTFSRPAQIRPDRAESIRKSRKALDLGAYEAAGLCYRLCIKIQDSSLLKGKIHQWRCLCCSPPQTPYAQLAPGLCKLAQGDNMDLSLDNVTRNHTIFIYLPTSSTPKLLPSTACQQPSLTWPRIRPFTLIYHNSLPSASL